MENETLHQLEILEEIKNNLKKEIIQLDDEILYQSFGIYKPQYDFAELDQYKERLKKLRDEQKQMIKAGTAAICTMDWVVQGDKLKGIEFSNNTIKQILRNFNLECDICIDKVTFSNYENTQKRICNSFNLYNRLNEVNKTYISKKYLLLKLDELDLSYEYKLKKKEEKEFQKELREQRKEEELVIKEIEAKRLELEKEHTHYENALKKINEQIQIEQNEERKQFLFEKKEELNNKTLDVDKALQDLDYREANHKAGYVYIISNIGAFGENVYKIGMTRRLEYQDRIDELSGASVPFRFDIHAAIFSDDAPKLEAALHNAFADKKINLVNGRKEFFRVTLEEIKKVVNENYDQTVDWKDVAEAQQYRESLMIRRKIGALE